MLKKSARATIAFRKMVWQWHFFVYLHQKRTICESKENKYFPLKKTNKNA